MIVPIAFAMMGIRTGKYKFTFLTLAANLAILISLSAVNAPRPPLLLADTPPQLLLAVALSIAGDYFMGHKSSPNDPKYLAGIVSFFAAHGCYLWYVLSRFTPTWQVFCLAGALISGYAVYIARRILPHVPGVPMKLGVAMYAMISAAVLGLSLGFTSGMPEKVLFISAIACLVFSDTMIAEADFAGNKRVGFLIMPTYFACHILLVASVIAGIT